MTSGELEKVFEDTVKELSKLLNAGQQEYAHRKENVFANFERVGERLGLDRKQVLMVYAEKHLDGVHSFIKGHKSQRESVSGRIHDLIVYMILLKGMCIQDSMKQLHKPLEE